jgi:hypothetical protein
VFVYKGSKLVASHRRTPSRLRVCGPGTLCTFVVTVPATHFLVLLPLYIADVAAVIVRVDVAFLVIFAWVRHTHSHPPTSRRPCDVKPHR